MGICVSHFVPSSILQRLVLKTSRGGSGQGQRVRLSSQEGGARRAGGPRPPERQGCRASCLRRARLSSQQWRGEQGRPER